MKSGSFIKLIASTYGLPEKSVFVVARALRENDKRYLTTGARGINAPDMTLVDAARLTLALLTGEAPSKVVEEYEFMRTLHTAAKYSHAGLLGSCNLADDHSLEDVIIALFQVTADPEITSKSSWTSPGPVSVPCFSIAVDRSRRTAEVRLPDQVAVYLEPLEPAEVEYPPKGRVSDQYQQPGFAENTDTLIFDHHQRAVATGMRIIREVSDKEIKVIAGRMSHADQTSQLWAQFARL